MDHALVVQGVAVPAFFYGTAWKEERTAELTRLALEAGFSAIDTANQRRHYHEEAVGDALAAVLARGRGRDELFVQTKFTHRAGQDHRLPYDPDARPAVQVEQSIASSLRHLRLARVDSYVLHGPERAAGLSEGDLETWRAMEAAQRAGQTRLLGVSNVSLEQLEALHRRASVKPAFVQNRCFARNGWDLEVRAFCRARGLVYQGFSLLTANPRVVAGPVVQEIARRISRTPAQVVFRFALQAGMIPLTGTSSAAHMQQDLACFEFSLEDHEMQALERAGR